MIDTRKLKSMLLDLDCCALDARLAIEAIEAVAANAMDNERIGDERPTIDAHACCLICGLAVQSLEQFKSKFADVLDAVRCSPPVAETSAAPDE